MSILGAGGSCRDRGVRREQDSRTWQFTESIPGDDEVVERFSVNPPDVYGFGHLAYYNHVVSALISGAPQLVDGLEGRRSIELISAIYESIETGRPVSLRFRPTHLRLGEIQAETARRTVGDGREPTILHAQVRDVTFGSASQDRVAVEPVRVHAG